MSFVPDNHPLSKHIVTLSFSMYARDDDPYIACYSDTEKPISLFLSSVLVLVVLRFISFLELLTPERHPKPEYHLHETHDDQKQ